MKNDQKILAVIPARGGSKGIKRKNIRELAGKPLLVYSIEAALKSKYIDKVVVSTEDNSIAEIAKRYGADIIKRPLKLALDESPQIETIFHVLETLKPRQFQIIILLQPTSPLRTYQDIDNAIENFLGKDCQSLVSVCTSHKELWSLKIEKGYLKPIFPGNYLKRRRQNLPTIYVPNGAIFISDVENLRKFKGFYSDKTLPFVMPLERSIDIDTEFDFILAETLLKRFK
jgi:CMP-N-acetylneuraminic acid synthetase